LHFKGKKCVLQASINLKLQIRLKNICFDAVKLARGCNTSFTIYHLSFTIYQFADNKNFTLNLKVWADKQSNKKIFGK